MSLSPGTKIGRYEIRSLLGAGGMGEVWRAFDTHLERPVALKFLKHADDEEKLRRFRQEARAISALNHPGILTIHEVGEFEEYHYIVSEIVAGENLREVAARKNLTFDEILDIGIQIGNALAAAHQVGIVHRDIKPENVMILPADGYVKVLDFGLAKFVEIGDQPAPDFNDSTASLVHTKAGMIIGTVNYMSPEQLRGKPIDERTDIWSLGIVLFELCARRRPFAGESANDVIAAVLERELPPMSRDGSDVPPEIETVVSKALQKDKERRFQTVREFVAALKNIRGVSANWSLAVGADNNRQSALDSFHSRQTVLGEAGQISSGNSSAEKNLSGVFIAGTQFGWRGILAAGLLLSAAIAVAGWFFVYQPLAKQSPVSQMKTQRFTSTGNVSNGAISPDGRFVVYVQNQGGQQSLWLRQVEEAAARELIPPGADSYSGLTFAPDGNWIYYTTFDGGGMGKLSRVRLLGGTPQTVASDVDSAIAFAPDGKSFAFIRSNPRAGVDQIVISNVDAGERILSERRRPEFYLVSARESLSWSPDGKSIACPFGRTGADGEFMSVAEINVETGEQRFVTDQKWHRVGRVIWMKNADELLITAADFGTESFQIRKIYRADGRAQNVTGELSDYFNLSLNQNSTLLLAAVYEKNSKLLVAAAEQPSQTKSLAGGGGYDGIGGAAWTNDGQILYVSTEDRSRDIWVRDAAESNPQQLTLDKSADEYPSISADGKHIVFVSSRTGVPHIWRMNRGGGDLKQLTDRGGESFPIITPDGKFVIYSRAENRPLLWKVSVEGGETMPLTKEQTSGAAISPDGKFIVCLTRADAPDAPTLLALVSAETGEILKTFQPSGIVSSPGLPPSIRWLPGSETFAYAANINGVSNVWTQAVSGGEPKRITDFTTDRIFSFDISPDGKKFVYASGAVRNDLVLIENF